MESVDPDERIVVFNTGAAQKYVEVLSEPVLPLLDTPVDWAHDGDADGSTSRDRVDWASAVPMWANREWVGTLPPGRHTGGRGARRLLAGVQRRRRQYDLLRDPRDPTAVQRWVDLTLRTGFRFAFKLPRTITHDRRLRDVGPGAGELFIETAGPALADRLGPVCIQLPASFGPDSLPVLE